MHVLTAPVSTPQRSIKSMAEGIVNQHAAEMGWRDPRDYLLSIDEIYQTVIYPQSEYEIITSQDLGYYREQKVLGKTIPANRVVMVDRNIVPPQVDRRYSFTLAHEFGHALLHGGTQVLSRCTEPMITITSDYNQGYLESEANRFAVNLLMPEKLVFLHFKRCYQPRSPISYNGPATYSLSIFGNSKRVKVDSFTHFCRTLAQPLRIYFSNVSKTSLGLRLHQLSFVVNRTTEPFVSDSPGGPVTIGQVVGRIKILRRR